nr:hypothetical protein BaRGS_025936 [Batillaria attramentaria]
MDLRVYPFDTQHCRMVLYVYSHVGVHATHVESDVIGAALVQEAFAVRAEWTLVNITVEQKMMNTLGDTYLEYTWIIKRKTTFFVISFIVPIVMTSYMNVLVFIIPAECGEKISYLVSIFVSNAVFVSFCTDEMPQGMDSTPLVMYLVLGIMAESGILIVINSILLRHFHRNQQPSNAEPGTVSTTLTCTPCTPSKRRLSASTVHPYDENIKGDDLGGEAKELRAPERSVKTADKMTAMDKGFFVFTFTLNTAFVISLLLTICQ